MHKKYFHKDEVRWDSYEKELLRSSGRISEQVDLLMKSTFPENFQSITISNLFIWGRSFNIYKYHRSFEVPPTQRLDIIKKD